jgi:5'-methylthioadenosine phosphorylase
MTNMPEAKLAREAELCYATVAMVTDYDCWHPEHDHVTVDAIVKVLLANADRARSLARHAIPMIHADPQAPACACRTALEHAVITAPGHRDPAALRHLDAVAGRLLKLQEG